MKPWRLRLRTMTAIIITTMLIFAVALVYFGVSWYADNIEERIIAQLSPDAAKAFSDIDLGMMPDQRQLQALVEVLPGLEDQADNELIKSVFVFGLLGVFLCSLLGYFISRRIAAPLGELADAARRMATGNFSGGAKIKASPITEVAFLVDSFETSDAGTSDDGTPAEVQHDGSGPRAAHPTHDPAGPFARHRG